MTDLHLFVAGAGSVGAELCESVTRTSVAPDAGFRLVRVTVLDQDVLEPGNLHRHNAGPGDVGRRKVDFVAARVRELAPGVEVDALHGSLFDHDLLPAVEGALARATVVAGAFDNPPALFRLNELAVRHGKPLVAAEVISGGIGLWLLVANAGARGPCVLCLARARGERIDLSADRPAGPHDYRDPAAAAPEARVPADDWACTAAAALAAGLVVDAARRGGEVDPDTPPLRLVALRRVDEPPRVARFFRAPLQVTTPAAPRRDDCPVCAGARPVGAAEHARHLAFFPEAASEEEAP